MPKLAGSCSTLLRLVAVTCVQLCGARTHCSACRSRQLQHGPCCTSDADNNAVLQHGFLRCYAALHLLAAHWALVLGPPGFGVLPPTGTAFGDALETLGLLHVSMVQDCLLPLAVLLLVSQAAQCAWRRLCLLLVLCRPLCCLVCGTHSLRMGSRMSHSRWRRLPALCHSTTSALMTPVRVSPEAISAAL